jgi:SAM-dependent methyltransferase
MVATKVGVFDALAAGPRSAAEVATACGTKTFPTEKLLNALVGARYVCVEEGRYVLAARARKWLLPTDAGAPRHRILFQFLEWEIIGRTEEFLRTGEPLDAHGQTEDDRWGLYQRGMRAGLEPIAQETLARFRLPPGVRDMLDIGGSHGFWSVSFCRKYPLLRATVLDLPVAVQYAAPILAEEKMGDRVVHQAGNALSDDLGEERYDFIFMAQLVHHFDVPTNRALMARCARALRPGGTLAIFEPFRVDASNKVGQFGGLLDLFFALTSASGTFSPGEMADWQRGAGLVPRKPLRLKLVGELGVQAATKPAGNTAP